MPRMFKTDRRIAPSRSLNRALMLVGSILFVGCALTAPRPLSPSEHASLLIAEYGELQVAPCTATIARLATLASTNGSTNTPQRILVLNTATPLALSPSPGLLVLSKGALLLLPTEAELFFIIAHEVGHAELGHHSSSSRATSSHFSSFKRELELAADAYALKHLLSAGYPLTAALTALQRADASAIRATSESDIFSDYPSLKERTQSLVVLSQSLLAEQHKAPLAPLERRDYQECRAALRAGNGM